MTRSVAILLFDEVEVLDACGPFEVFSVANRVSRRDRPAADDPFQVSTFVTGERREAVARGGLVITASHTLDGLPAADIVVIPGGVTGAVETDLALLGWLRERRADTEVIAAVCTGAFVLAEAGLLAGRAATTHWEDLADLRRRFPDVEVQDGPRYLDGGDFATSAGVSAGIDLALHLVARFAGADLATATARQMDYPWTDGGRQSPH